MRDLLCESCGNSKHKLTGVRMLYAGGGGEPSEYERVIWGRARKAQSDQRVRYISDFHYDCDLCNAPIRPGDRCMTWTVWVEDRAWREGDEPAWWEDEYLERE
jgi:hypothetical protein